MIEATPGHAASRETAGNGRVPSGEAPVGSGYDSEKAFLAAILESSHDSIISINFAGKITSWNRAAERLYGYSAAEAIGKPLTMLTLPEDLAQVLERIERIKHSQKVETFDTVRVHKDAHEMWLSITISPVKDPDGNVIGVSTIARDVTDHRRAEEKLRESEARQAYLVKLSDALRTLGDPVAIQRTAMRVLGEELCVDRVMYADVDEAGGELIIGDNYLRPGVPPFVGRIPIARFADVAQALQVGEVVCVGDVRSDARISDAVRAVYQRLGVVAMADVPLIKDGRWISNIGLHHLAARDWTNGEMLLLRETAERTWAAVERARAEDAVRHSEQRFKALVTAGTYSIYRMSPDWRRMYQLHSDALAGTSEPIEDWIDKYILEEDRARVFAAIEAAIRTKSLFELEHHVRLGDGTVGWVLSRAVPILGPDGEIVEWFGAGSNVTARKRAELALRESEERYHALFESMDEAYAVVEVLKNEHKEWADFRFIEVNPAFMEHTSMSNPVGRTATELLGTPNPRWTQIYGEVLDTGTPRRIQETEGALERTFDLNIFALDRELNRVAVLFTNITDRKRSQEALQASEEQFRRALEEAPIPVIMQAEDGQVLQISRTWTELTGYTQAEIPTFDAWVNRAFGPGANTVREHMHALFAGTLRQLDAEFEVTTRTGETRCWAFSASAPGTLHDGRRYIVGMALDITGRKEGEAALRESQARLRTMAENLPGGAAFILDREQRYLLAGGEAFAAAGFTGEDFIGRTLTEAVGPELAACYEPFYRQALAGESFSHEHEGHGRTFLSRGVPLCDGAGGVPEILVVSYDITERKRAEEAVRESEERLQTLADAVPQMIWANDGNGTANYFNRRWYEYTGLNFGESFGLGWEAVVHPDDARASKTAWQQAQTAGEIFDSEYRLRDAKGAYRWFIGRNVPMRDPAGRVTGWFGTATDIQELKEAEAALRETQERIRLIVENAREYAIFSQDLDRRITSWNSGAQGILGYSPDEAIGQTGDIIFTPEDRAAGAPETEALTARSEGRAANERWHLRKDQSRFWGSGVMMAMRDTSGKAIGLVKIFRDQTEQLRSKEEQERHHQELREALRETEQAREAAEAATRAKDHFLAVLSHELRTPLTPVLMAVHILAREKNLSTRSQEALSMIERNVKLEAHFVDELLDLTRVARGKMELISEPMDVHDALTKAEEVVRGDIEAKAQTLTLKLEATDHALTGDFKRLQQVFWNLLKNASKFTPESGALSVRTYNEPSQASGAPARILVEITDTGIGFEPEAAERIFDAFTQADEAITREFGGLGLGLAISKATVDAHGGLISARSGGPGHGATFTVELPIA